MNTEPTPKSTSEPFETVTADREQHRDRELEEAFGSVSASWSDELKNKIYADEKLMKDALSAKYAEHDDAKKTDETINEGHETEKGEDNLDQAPTDLPSTPEAEAMQRSNSLVRRLAQKSLGFVKTAGWVITSPYRATQMGITWVYGKSYDAAQKSRFAMASLTGEEREEHIKKVGKRANIAAWGAGALYLTYLAATKSHSLPWESTGSNSGAVNTPEFTDSPKSAANVIDQGQTGTANSMAPELQDTQNFRGADFAYGPAHDPALNPAKHGNDWGTSLTDHNFLEADKKADKPAGYSEFFNSRIRQSPDEFSATLSEFGLNGKDGASINNLADQMRNNPALAQDKYDQLMKVVNSGKVYEMTYDGNYGSYYAVANPDGSVTLSYDTDVAGHHGNRFIVVEVDGVKHYMHTDCGGQWSHFKVTQPAQTVAYQPQGGGTTEHIVKRTPNTPRPPVDRPPVDHPPTGNPPTGNPPTDNPPVLEPKPSDINEWQRPGTDDTTDSGEGTKPPVGPDVLTPPPVVERRAPASEPSRGPNFTAPGATSSSSTPGSEVGGSRPGGSSPDSGVGQSGSPQSTGGSTSSGSVSGPAE